KNTACRRFNVLPVTHSETQAGVKLLELQVLQRSAATSARSTSRLRLHVQQQALAGAAGKFGASRLPRAPRRARNGGGSERRILPVSEGRHGRPEVERRGRRRGPSVRIAGSGRKIRRIEVDSRSTTGVD